MLLTLRVAGSDFGVRSAASASRSGAYVVFPPVVDASRGMVRMYTRFERLVPTSGS